MNEKVKLESKVEIDFWTQVYISVLCNGMIEDNATVIADFAVNQLKERTK